MSWNRYFRRRYWEEERAREIALLTNLPKLPH